MVTLYLTWLDSNSWLIEMAGQHILLDPWLVGDLTFGNLSWLFRGKHPHPRPIPDRIDLILLSQGLEDHAHPPTLEQLDRQIPVVASPNAAKVVQKLGYRHVTILEHGDRYIHNQAVAIEAFPGSPIGPTLVENGYLLTDRVQNTKLYYEPHGYHDASLQAAAPVDVVIAPLVDLKIPFLGSIIKGSQSAVKAVEWLQPQIILPTAAGGEVEFEGMLMSILQAEGDVEAFQSLLHQRNLSTKVLSPQPEERVKVELIAS